MEAVQQLTLDGLQEALRAIWEDELGFPVEDIDADFFSLGGDSLTALAVAITAARQGIPMPRSGVLRRPSIRDLAEAVLAPELFEQG